MTTIDVISDVICPWCYVGKRRLWTDSDLIADARTKLDVVTGRNSFQIPERKYLRLFEAG